jgi:hypothetical protein
VSWEDDWLESSYEDRHYVPDDGDRAGPDPDDLDCDHEETREEQDAATGQRFDVCESCGASFPA